MKRISSALLLSCVVILAASPSAWAVNTSTASVACSPKVSLQAKIDGVASGTIATFNVSGTCNENITVPHGKTIIIKGVTLAAKITPKDASLDTVVSHGDTTIQGMTITNTSGTADTLVKVERSATLDIIGSDLSAPNVGSVVGFWGGSFGRIFNSRISGGTDDAVEDSDGSDLVIIGTPSVVSGPVGSKVVLTSSNGVALSCNDGASLAMQSKTANSADGAIEINNSKVGIYISQCQADIVNKTAVVSNFKITGMANAAINIQEGGNGRFKNIDISNNSGVGLGIFNTGTANIYNSTLSGNTQGDMNLGYGAIVSIPGWPGASSLPDAFSANTIYCFQSSEVPSAKILVDGNGGLTIPAGKSLIDLESNNAGCISVQ